MSAQVQELLEGIKGQVSEQLKDFIKASDLAQFVKGSDLAKVQDQLAKLQANLDTMPLVQAAGEKSGSIHEMFTKAFKETGKYETDLRIKAIRQSQNVTGAPVDVASLTGSAFAPNPMRELASVLETSATALSLPVRTGNHGAAKAAATRPTSAPTTGTGAVGSTSVAVETFEALNEVSIEAAEDIPGFDEFWTADIVNELAALEAQSHAAVIPGLTKVVSAGTGVINLADLAALMWGVNPAYRANGSWMVSSPAMAAIRTMNASGNGSDLLFDAQLGAFRLFGQPVYENAFMAPIAAGNCPVAFGDFKRGVVIASRAVAKVGRYEQTKPGYYTYYGVLRSGAAQYVPGAVQALQVKAA